MKSIVFDNAGTILQRVTALNDLVNEEIVFETNTIGIANEKSGRIIVVLQEPTKSLIKHDGRIVDYLNKYPERFEISYSHGITKEQVLKTIFDDKTTILDIKKSAIELIKKYDVEICSGSALIIDMFEKRIDYVYTAGGCFFKDTLSVIKNLQNNAFNIYIASGDNKQSLSIIASRLNIPQSNIFDTQDSLGKQHIVEELQENDNYVYMVGNNLNDLLAIKKADVGILTLEQKEKVSETLIKEADYIINSIGEINEIIKRE